ncbi:hypothetical protein FVE89_05825 [Methylobacterium sp. 2A]|nr:hypothetical protein [Methylobacterium sp. 2A]
MGSHPYPHPEVPERSGGLEGALQGSQRPLEPSFEAAAQHLRMRFEGGITPLRRLRPGRP